MSDRRTITIEAPRDLPGDYRIRIGEHDERAFVAIDAAAAT